MRRRRRRSADGSVKNVRQNRVALLLKHVGERGPQLFAKFLKISSIAIPLLVKQSLVDDLPTTGEHHIVVIVIEVVQVLAVLFLQFAWFDLWLGIISWDSRQWQLSKRLKRG